MSGEQIRRDWWDAFAPVLPFAFTEAGKKAEGKRIICLLPDPVPAQRFATFAKLPSLSRVRLPCRGQGLPQTRRSDSVRRAARWTRERCPYTNRENGVQLRQYRLRRSRRQGR